METQLTTEQYKRMVEQCGGDLRKARLPLVKTLGTAREAAKKQKTNGGRRFLFRIPVATKSNLNIREHWVARAKRAKRERDAATVAALAAGVDPRCLPAVIVMIRQGQRQLDDDNLAGALKHIQDGIADALGIDDADKRVRWLRSQTLPVDLPPCVIVNVGTEIVHDK